MGARWIALLLFLALGGQIAQADEVARAKAAYRKGQAHYRLGEFEQALTAFKEAYRNREDPSFLFNIAQCERQLGHKPEAERMYTSYLRTWPEAPNRAEVEQLISTLHAQIEEEKKAVEPPPPTAPLPSVAAPAAAPTVVVQAPPPRRPIYKRWWLWTTIGGAVAVGLAVGLGVGLTRHPSNPTASTTLGTQSFAP